MVCVKYTLVYYSREMNIEAEKFTDIATTLKKSDSFKWGLKVINN
jgi:hypothetical protein